MNILRTQELIDSILDFNKRIYESDFNNTKQFSADLVYICHLAKEIKSSQESFLEKIEDKDLKSFSSNVKSFIFGFFISAIISISAFAQYIVTNVCGNQ